ncbi:MAG: hypothetical protein A3E01_00380 [Gammaproteobacteria bacterium RIFCSPHIGHO2_12_FULL_63_22]|nr:MAG: hypothetical protein A3E01_00380 [Gammaproteobacteria bacterium RIFCSPHIGHO2_12_FULL_63_22]
MSEVIPAGTEFKVSEVSAGSPGVKTFRGFSQFFDPKEERLRYICHIMARQGVVDWAARTGLMVEPRK